MFGISSFAEAPFASLSGVTVVVAITGVQASGAVGTVAQNTASALTGVSALGLEGNLFVGANTIGLVNELAIGTAGTASAVTTVGITGVAASGHTGFVGTESPIEGVEAVGSTGTVGSTRIVTLTGVASTGAVGDVAETNSPTEDSVVAYGAVGTIAPTSRTVALTGVSGQGIAGTPLYFYWTTIDDNEVPNWQNVEMTV